MARENRASRATSRKSGAEEGRRGEAGCQPAARLAVHPAVISSRGAEGRRGGLPARYPAVISSRRARRAASPLPASRRPPRQNLLSLRGRPARRAASPPRLAGPPTHQIFSRLRGRLDSPGPRARELLTANNFPTRARIDMRFVL